MQTNILAELLPKLQECFQCKKLILEGKSVINMNLLNFVADNRLMKFVPALERLGLLRTKNITDMKINQISLKEN